MGKKLIILGADFSENGIAAEFTTLKAIVANNTTQWISLTDTSFLTPSVKAKVQIGYYGNGTPSLKFGVFHRSSIPDHLMVSSQNINSIIYTNVRYGNHQLDPRPANVVVTSGVPVTVTLTPTKTIRTNGTTTYEDNYEATNYPNSHNNFCLFGSSVEGTNSINIGNAFYNCKIYTDASDDTSLVHDFIPVKKKDGTVCIYDLVTEQYFYTNDETNPSYIESDGTFVE